VVDYYAAALVAGGVASALYERERSGQGQQVGVSLMRVGAGHAVGPAGLGRRRAARGGRDMRSGGITGIHPTREGHLYISANTPHFWRALCEKTGLMDLHDEAALRHRAQARAAPRCEIVPRLHEALAARSALQWEAHFGDDVPCAAARPRWPTCSTTRRQLAQGMIERIEHPVLGSYQGFTRPWVFGRTPGPDAVRRAGAGPAHRRCCAPLLEKLNDKGLPRDGARGGARRGAAARVAGRKRHRADADGAGAAGRRPRRCWTRPRRTSRGRGASCRRCPRTLKQTVRERLVATLLAYARSGRDAPPRPATDALLRMMSVGVGQPVPAEYIPLLLEEMHFGDEDTRAVQWQRDPSSLPVKDFKVIVIGAGLGGLCAAIRLKQLGIPFEVLEKNADVGGTWLENAYPGCAVDTPNHFYSYSFHVNNRWTRHFSRRDEILAYIREVVRFYDLAPHIRFNVEATSAEFDEARNGWRVGWNDAQGRSHTAQCNALITAVGQLNRPAFPKIPGLDTFKGPAFHTAEWDASVDLKGKRVAMIGTGASGMQAGPSIAPDVAHLRVFQRSSALGGQQPQLPPGR
jgi:hypothetical protein